MLNYRIASIVESKKTKDTKITWYPSIVLIVRGLPFGTPFLCPPARSHFI